MQTALNLKLNNIGIIVGKGNNMSLLAKIKINEVIEIMKQDDKSYSLCFTKRLKLEKEIKCLKKQLVEVLDGTGKNPPGKIHSCTDGRYGMTHNDGQDGAIGAGIDVEKVMDDIEAVIELRPSELKKIQEVLNKASVKFKTK